MGDGRGNLDGPCAATRPLPHAGDRAGHPKRSSCRSDDAATLACAHPAPTDIPLTLLPIRPRLVALGGGAQDLAAHGWPWMALWQRRKTLAAHGWPWLALWQGPLKLSPMVGHSKRSGSGPKPERTRLAEANPSPTAQKPNRPWLAIVGIAVTAQDLKPHGYPPP